MFDIISSLLSRLPLLFITYLTPTFVFSILKVLGVSFISFVALDSAIDYLVTFLRDSMTGLPADIFSGLLYFGFVDGIKTYLSAMVVAWQILEFRGSFRRLSFIQPSNMGDN